MRQDSASKVLVVDDDAVAGALVAQLLQMAGFAVVTARTGEAALAQMIEQRDDIAWLVTKAKLPGLVCGLLLADEFSRWHPTHPVLVAGGFSAVAANAIAVAHPMAPIEIVEVLKGLRAAAQVCPAEPTAAAASAQAA
jgi:DNA-binding NtrC family response regulator